MNNKDYFLKDITEEECICAINDFMDEAFHHHLHPNITNKTETTCLKILNRYLQYFVKEGEVKN